MMTLYNVEDKTLQELGHHFPGKDGKLISAMKAVVIENKLKYLFTGEEKGERRKIFMKEFDLESKGEKKTEI